MEGAEAAGGCLWGWSLCGGSGVGSDPGGPPTCMRPLHREAWLKHRLLDPSPEFLTPICRSVVGPEDAISSEYPGEADAANPGTALQARRSHWQLSSSTPRSEARGGVVF